GVREMLAGPLPYVPVGLHCFEPRECPFMKRCWPDTPDHIRNLAGVGPKKTAAYLARGITSIADLPPKEKLNFTQKRQLKAMAEHRIIVEPTLAAELAPFGGVDFRLGFLDFETIARAIPVWPGMAPWQQAAAQFSYHERQPDGSYTHAAFLAEGPDDARPKLAAAMVRATIKADRVVTYTGFEKTRIRELQQAVPDLAAELAALEAKLIDLHPVVKNCVYHPDFLGSFSLKDILTPLVPELTYDDLVIVDGRVASVEIARLLFVADKIPRHERDRVRRDLLNYCERDTWAMVKLVERLQELGAAKTKSRKAVPPTGAGPPNPAEKRRKTTREGGVTEDYAAPAVITGPAETSAFLTGSILTFKPSRAWAPSRDISPGSANTTSSGASEPPARMSA